MSSSGETTDRLAYLEYAADALRCVVRVRIGTQAIRALFAGEKPPVPDAEWDEAAYVEQRLRAYRDALEPLARVRPMPWPSGRDGRDEGHADRDGGDRREGHDAVDDDASAALPAGVVEACCARTGDRVTVDLGDPGDLDAASRASLLRDVENALQRVFADAHAWRRCLLPAYFERHRSWRAVAGAPIQH